jgi:hypothetical protein
LCTGCMIEDHKHREKVTQMRNQDPGFELIINFFFFFSIVSCLT